MIRTQTRIVRGRVLRALLDRYVGEDLLYHEPNNFRVPRFLLNDYVRYWRTMAVDSAQKRRDRTQKWALRNIKLRLSRKLIFVAGLWACLSCDLHPSAGLQKARKANDRTAVGQEMTSFLMSFSQQSPLETLASAFLRYKAWNAALRKRLEKLTLINAMSDETFKRGKKDALEFQKGLTTLFFHTDKKLTSATEIDGVF